MLDEPHEAASVQEAGSLRRISIFEMYPRGVQIRCEVRQIGLPQALILAAPPSTPHRVTSRSHLAQGLRLEPIPPLAVMPPCLWLIWMSGLTQLSLKGWALVVTYEEDPEAFGTLFKVRSTGRYRLLFLSSQLVFPISSSRTLAQG